MNGYFNFFNKIYVRTIVQLGSILDKEVTQIDLASHRGNFTILVEALPKTSSF